MTIDQVDNSSKDDKNAFFKLNEVLRYDLLPAILETSTYLTLILCKPSRKDRSRFLIKSLRIQIDFLLIFMKFQTT